MYQSLSRNIPIVIADAQQFFTLRESAPPEIQSRLVYLRVPAGIQLPDPTVVNQLMRWKAIDPSLPVYDIDSYLKSHDEFYVLDTHAGTDDTPLNYLLQHTNLALKKQFGDGALLLEKRVPCRYRVDNRDLVLDFNLSRTFF